MKPSPRVLGRPRYDDKAQPTREVILNMATKLFIKEGYKNVSMDDVAQACNVTKATIYYYYPTKADLYTASLVAMMTRIQRQINTILTAPTLFKERLNQLVEVHLSATVHIDMNNFMREATIHLSENQLKEVRVAENAMYEAVKQVMQEEMDKGSIRQGHAQFFAHAFIALLTVGYFKDSQGKRLFETVEKTAKEITDFFWMSVRIQ